MTAATEQPRPKDWRPFRHDAHVGRTFDKVRSYLSATPGRLLGDGPAAEPGAAGRRTGLHLRRAGLDVSREINVVLGDLETGSRSLRVPIQWVDARRPRLFPALEAILDITPSGSDDLPATRVELTGRYAPPLGRFGALADVLGGNRLVIESVDRFLTALVDRLERDLPPEPERPAFPAEPGSAPRLLDLAVEPPTRRRRVYLPVQRGAWQAGVPVAIEQRLRGEPGVLDVVLDPSGETVVIGYDPTICGLSHLAALLGEGAPA